MKCRMPVFSLAMGGAIIAIVLSVFLFPESTDAASRDSSKDFDTLSAAGNSLKVRDSGGTAAPLPSGSITFVESAWSSVQLQTYIARYMLENGYGYATESEFAPITQQPALLLSGEAQVVMEAWLPPGNRWDQPLEEGDLVNLGASLGSDWRSAFVIPAYMQEQYPGLDHVNDLKEQQYKSLFATPETGGKARLVSCIPGWSCEETNRLQIEEYGLDDHVHIVNPDSGADLFASINGAYENREPWLGYMWATGDPALLLELVRLEEPPMPSAYQDTDVVIVAHPDLPDYAPEAAEVLRKWDFAIDPHLKSVTRWRADNPGASIEDMGLYWLRNNEATWSGWVTPEAAAGIRMALAGIVGRYDKDNDGVISITELFDAIDAYFEGAIGVSDLFDVIDAYFG